MNKKGISATIGVLIVILLTIFAMWVIWTAMKPVIEKMNCFPNYAKDLCLKNNLVAYGYDDEAKTVICWTNKAKGETKTFYLQGEICK